jgi:nucleoside-diphosphate-sugar epimerase
VKLKDIAFRIGRLIGKPDLIRLGAIPAAPTDTPLVVADTTKLRETLGWRPQHDLESGLAQTIAWFRAQMNVREAAGQKA